jgi:FkbM family methyltransferase
MMGTRHASSGKVEPRYDAAVVKSVATSALRNPLSERVVRALGLRHQLDKSRSGANQVAAELEHRNLVLLLTFLLTPTDHCIDIGASHGVMLAHMVRCAPRGHHLAFEPIPELYRQLMASFPSADVRCLALADETGQKEFNWLPQTDGYSGLFDYKYAVTPAGRSITVPTDRLDNQVPDGYVPSLIKIDVEGAEYAVLQGAQHTLTQHRPVLVVEYPRRAVPMPGMNREDLYALLVGNLEYRVFDLVGNGPLDEASFVGSPALNFLFHL